MINRMNVTTPTDREIVVTRTFNASRDLVFRAHTEPALLQRWLAGPEGWAMASCEVDLRVGGRFRYVWRSEAENHEFGTGGEFKEITSPKRIVHTEMMDGYESYGEALMSAEFAEQDGRTVLTLTMLFPSKEARDGAAASGMTDGMATTYDRLDGLLSANLAQD